eukprot:3261050-Pleurochrysis_carterae.AAC.1
MRRTKRNKVQDRLSRDRAHCSERPVPIVGEEEAVELRREGQVARRGAVRRLRAAPESGSTRVWGAVEELLEEVSS